MPFLNGTMSAMRFRHAHAFRRLAVDNPFDNTELEILKRDNADARPLSDSDPQHGWAGGNHELDVDFHADKNLLGQYLHFAFRVTEIKPPPSRVKALAEMEMAAAEKSGQSISWAEAKDIALAQIEEEAKDGRYTKHTLIPIVWDGEHCEVWYGTGSEKHVGLFTALFKESFGIDLEQITASDFNTKKLENDTPPVWMEPSSDDWLGNEFMMWLMAKDRDEEHIIARSTFAVMNRVELACPHGEKGRDVITTMAPAKSPEVTTAVKDGRIARKLGLIVVTPDGNQFEFTLGAERWTVTGVKVPDNEDLNGVEEKVFKLDRCHELFNCMDKAMREFVDEYEVNMEHVNMWTKGESV